MNDLNALDQLPAPAGVRCSRMVRRLPITPERHRRAVERYLNSAQPYLKARCDLEMQMPLAFAVNPDGSLTKIEQYNWPEWAKAKAACLDMMIAAIQEKAFADA